MLSGMSSLTAATPEALLAGLNDAQREACLATTGPVAILAGAGTGKTRVISHRVAYAVATGAVEPGRVLLVTFTDKAATEMVQRVAALELSGASRVAARTFHSAALAQLRHYWPLRNSGQPLPEILSDPFRIVAPLARRLPGGYTWTPAKDLIDELSWARSRRITPERYAESAEEVDRTPPIPPELFARFYHDYERAKARQGVIDFDDMLTRTVDLLETDEEAAEQVRGRYRWFSVDEYQDTSPLQQRLLELWLGDRRDLCVVGDEDQTIYSFAGATPRFLTGFAARFPDARVIPLLENFRSTPQVLDLANRLLASTGRTKRLTATRPSGPAATVRQHKDGEEELRSIVAQVRELMAAGVAPREIAVLVRLNAQVPPIEAALTRAGIPYRVRGQRFFQRPEVRAAVESLRRVPATVAGAALVQAVRSIWQERLGFQADGEPAGREARERQAALDTLLAIVEERVSDGSADREAIEAELAGRAEAERSGSDDGVELSTLHRAKGLEWEAVFLPSLEEGLLPVAQAKDEPEAIDEERRLLYVGITRARVHLALSWARQRTTAKGNAGQRQMSRFLRGLAGADASAGGSSDSSKVAKPPAAGPRRAKPPAATGSDDPLMVALRAWRTERARADAMPPYVIAHDSTLAAIAERRPTSLSELARVPGIGPAKLEKYGAEILAALKALG